jgi:hypothetical protein
VLTTTQHFDTISDIQNQVVDARVWLGFHFRNSVKQGENLGNNVAAWELRRFFQPARHQGSSFRLRAGSAGAPRRHAHR